MKKKETLANPVVPVSVPKPTEEELKQLLSDDAKVREMSLFGLLDKSLTQLPKDHLFKMRDRREVELALHAAFELIGGVPKLATWANGNPTEFFRLYARLIPESQKSQQNTQIIINSPIGKNELDNITIDGNTLDAAQPGDEDEY